MPNTRAKKIVREGLKKVKPFVAKVEPEMLIPKAFQPLAARQFLFELPGLDPFLVMKVEKGAYVRKEDRLQSKPELVVHLHDAIGPCTRTQLEELVLRSYTESLKAELKVLNPVGDVIQLFRYDRVCIERIDYPAWDYSTSGLSVIKLTLSYFNEKIES